MTNYLENKQITEEIVTYFKEMASRMVDDPNLLIPCYFCQESVEVWEALTVAHLFAGVPAHFSCPKEAFMSRLIDLGLEPGYDFALLSEKIDQAMADGSIISTDTVSGSFTVRTFDV